MRININEKNTDNFPKEDRYDNYYRQKQKKRKKHPFLKFFIALIISLLIVFGVVYVGVRVAIGPTIERVNGLPDNFPEEIAIYQIDQAKIKLQSSDSKERLFNLLKIIPNWIIDPIIERFSDNLKQKLVNSFGDKIDVTKNFSAEDLKAGIDSVDPQKIDTVTMTWDNLPKSKEDIISYYKEKLAEGDFEFKENLSDYEINLGFWKDDIFGTMSFSNEAEKTEGEIMINYLSENKYENGYLGNQN